MSAQGKICDHHPNVIHLGILPSLLDRLLVRLLYLLPALLQKKLQSRWPEWFLPPKIVLKRQKIGWEEEFDKEIAIYRRLAPVQGTIVPVFYGEAVCPATDTTGTRALVLSDIGGVDLNEASGLETSRVNSMLMDSLLALANLGVSHDDSKLDNYRFVGDRIMVIDFDSSYFIEDDDPQWLADLQARFGTRLYWLVHGGERPKYG